MNQNPEQQAQITSILKNLDKPIVLIGMMGTGKSHIGSNLAKALGVPFYDSDALIEEKAGCSITELFEIFGEAKFRESEHKTILELLNNETCVIATGGGAPANADTLNTIKKQSLSVWLNVDAQDILKRLSGNKTRPLLQGDNPEQTLMALLKQRRPAYASADIEFQSGQGSVKSATKNLIKALSENLNEARF